MPNMKEFLVEEKIIIRPATLNDKIKVFEWLTNSNLTKEMMGLPDYPDAKIPSWEEFDNDYLNHYFDGSAPSKGRCYIIIEEGNEVGQINYNAIDNVKKVTDLDIWLSDLKYTGRGIGTEAIKLLCDYLNEEFGCEQIVMSPSKRNKYAIKSYEKAGFVMTDIQLDESEKDYEDNVVLIKKMKKAQYE
jgi:RimJ/RimL family protein N-acetyltransferase